MFDDDLDGASEYDEVVVDPFPNVDVVADRRRPNEPDPADDAVEEHSSADVDVLIPPFLGDVDGERDGGRDSDDSEPEAAFFKASFSLLAVLKGKRLGLPPSATFGRGLPDLITTTG